MERAGPAVGGKQPARQDAMGIGGALAEHELFPKVMYWLFTVRLTFQELV